MSDPVATVVADIKATVVKKANWFVALFVGVWHAIVWVWDKVLFIGKQLWSLVSDHQWDFDPYKLGGFASFVFAGWLALKTVALAEAKADFSSVSVIAGLVTVVIGMGTVLFSQSRKADGVLAGAKYGQ
jgi:hypothetical protein